MRRRSGGPTTRGVRSAWGWLALAAGWMLAPHPAAADAPRRSELTPSPASSSSLHPAAPPARFGLPTLDPRDGRFLSLVDDPTGLGGQRLGIELAVPAERDALRIELFDADTGRPCAAAADPPCALPALGHWDRGTTPLAVTLYADPARRGETGESARVGRWGGRDGHPTADPDGRWRAEPLFEDDRWWALEVVVEEAARAVSGVAYYHLVIELEPPTDGSTVSNFKLAADVPLAIRPGSRLGLEAGLGTPPNDLAILYPGYRSGEPFDFAAAASTYDGRMTLAFELPQRVERLTILEGDLDHGSQAGPGVPSGLPIEPCLDDDDPDTAGVPPEGGGNARPEGAQGAGRPADDHYFDALRRPPCVRYAVVDPAGRSYLNSNPSGSLEWERFTVSSRRRDGRLDADYAPGVAADGHTTVRGPLPAGLWRLDLVGLDLGNSSFWRIEHPVCGWSEEGAVCPARGEGCTPGFWKQRRHFDLWPAPYLPSTSLVAVFGGSLPARGLGAALAKGGGGLEALTRHAVAALLNAAAPAVSYELTTTEVVSLFGEARRGDRRAWEALKGRFETLNERHCPLP